MWSILAKEKVAITKVDVIRRALLAQQSSIRARPPPRPRRNPRLPTRVLKAKILHQSYRHDSLFVLKAPGI